MNLRRDLSELVTRIKKVGDHHIIAEYAKITPQAVGQIVMGNNINPTIKTMQGLYDALDRLELCGKVKINHNIKLV